MADESLAPNHTGTQGKRVLEDLRGRIFGRLTVIDLHPVRSKAKRARWICRCECGNETIVQSLNLKQGATISCGCALSDHLVARNLTHGQFGSPEHNTWHGMLSRCTNHNNKSYYNYGGRGITVCDRWHKFENFFIDMGHKSPNSTIERVNNNGNYEPDNCVWKTRHEQSRNKRNNVFINDNGIPTVLVDLALSRGIKYTTLYARIFTYGWSQEEAVSIPVGRRR